MVVPNVYLIRVVSELLAVLLEDAYLMKGEYMMKDEDPPEDRPTPSTSTPQREHGSDGPALPSPSTVPQDAPASTDPPLMDWRLTPRHHMRLLLLALVVGLVV